MFERRVSPSVYGIETEYSCMITLPGNVVHELVGSCHSPDTKLGLYEEPRDTGVNSIPATELTDAIENTGLFITSSGMLSNGGKLYIDPSGPEYATPETATADEAVHRSFDGDEILLGVFEHLRKQDIIEGYQINRRIVDHNRSSRGVHLNTTTSLAEKVQDQKAQYRIAALNVVKGAIFGSGGLLIDEKGDTAYHHSPRLSLTTNIARSDRAHDTRPLVRYPFKDDGELSRIETVTSDALNFAWPLRASLVVTNALIGVIELGYGRMLPELRNPIQAAHTVGRFGNTNRITAVDRKGQDVIVRPLDVMREICEVVLEIDHTEGYLDKESDQVIPEIIDVADKMTADMFSVANQVESVGRLVAMNRKMERRRLKLGSERMCRFDYAWDWLGGGIAEALRNKNAAGWQGFSTTHSAAASKRRRNIPPQDTRAKIRGEMIKRSYGENNSDWHLIDCGEGLYYVHPLSTEKPQQLPASAYEVFSP